MYFGQMHIDSFCLIPSVYLSQHIFYIQLQLVSYLFKLFSLFQLDCKFLESKSFVINSTIVTANEWVCLLFVILRSALFLHTKLFFFFKNFTWYYRKGGGEEISKSSLGDSIIAQQPLVLQNTSISVLLISFRKGKCQITSDHYRSGSSTKRVEREVSAKKTCQSNSPA